MMDVRPHQDHRVADERQVAGRGLRATIPDQTFAQLVDLHGAALRRFLLRLTNGNEERVHIIYQETLLRAWQHPECCERGLSASRTWLFTVARRISIDLLRAAEVRPSLVNDENLLFATADPVDSMDRVLLTVEVRAALATLSAAHQQVLQEMYFQDRPAADIAERLGVPVGTVKSRAYYALRAMQEALAGRGLDHALAKSA
jgi:RNA polymerase sigma-70 factor (ECF subfamily)